MKILILITLLTTLAAGSTLEVFMPTRNLAEGENGIVHVISYGAVLENPPRKVQGNGHTLHLYANPRFRTKTNDIAYAYLYAIEASRTGEFQLPIFSVVQNGKTIDTPSISFTYHPFSKFEKKTFTQYNKTYTYYSASFIKDNTLFVNQTSPVELRLLVPRDLPVRAWGITSVEESTNCYGWRPETAEPLARTSSYDYITTSLNLDSKHYKGIAYHSTLTPLEEGPAIMGGFKTNCLATFTVQKNAGFYQGITKHIDLHSELVNVAVKPLPPTSDPLFSGDVGEFTISTHKISNNTISINDSIKIELTVSGTGDFQRLKPPTLLDNKQWKLIDVTKTSSKNDRKYAEGKVNFEYLLSPLNNKITSTPRFAFTFFEPDSESFIKVSSTSAPIQIQSSSIGANSQATRSTPIEDQLSILGFLPLDDTLSEEKFSLPFSWHYMPLALLLVICGIYLLKLKRRIQNTETEKSLRKKELKELSSRTLSENHFYKGVGNFIDKWISSEKKDSVAHLIEKRDETCFKPNSTNLEKVDLLSRRKIIKTLSKLTLLFLVLTLHLPTADANSNNIDVASKHIDSGSYQEAILALSSEDKLTANGHYNLGVCYYKIGEVGLAALEFHRALEEDPFHKEAHQNISYISKEYLHQQQSEGKYLDKWLTKLPKKTYLSLFHGALWGVAIALSVFFLLKPKRFSLFNCFILTTLLFTLSILAIVSYQLYPKSIYFSDKSEMGVVILGNSTLQTEPITIDSSDSAKQVIVNIPIGSLCKVLAKRASWTYIELSSGTRGWLKSNHVKRIVEQDQGALESDQP